MFDLSDMQPGWARNNEGMIFLITILFVGFLAAPLVMAAAMPLVWVAGFYIVANWRQNARQEF